MLKAVWLCILLFAVMEALRGAPTQFGEKDTCAAMMKSWGQQEKIRISSDAQNLIEAGFARNMTKLAVVDSDRKWRGGERTLKQTLVSNYLDDLRDSKRSREGSAYDELKLYSIEASDVDAYPVAEFLGKVEPVLKGPKGELHVTSTPTGATIRLDKSSRGNTDKITVETAGKHRIVVQSKTLSCSDDINIPDGGTLRFQCP